MAKRFVAIWFRHLITDWWVIRQPAFQQQAFVFAAPAHGRMVITAASRLAQAEGIYKGMIVADARTLMPALAVFDDKPGRDKRLLEGLANWCIRYTPVAAVDLPDGLILDVSGCAHLWGGERPYLREIITRLKNAGYDVRAAIADTIGSAWAVARFGQVSAIVECNEQAVMLLPLPPAALRLSADILTRLQKFGLYRIGDFIHMPRSDLRRRFGESLLCRLDQALGKEAEIIQPVETPAEYQERLPCLEPLVTAAGIEIALKRLLETICLRLRQEEKGLRTAVLKGFRVDGKMEQIEIGTNSSSHNTAHLFKLFEPKIASLAPGMGIELFVLEAPQTEDLPAMQQSIWAGSCGLEDTGLAELLDRLCNKMGGHCIHRYLPAAHYWPERSARPAAALTEKAGIGWQVERPRPAHLLPLPEPIEVTAPIPDYPPMLFRYKGNLHSIKKADGPERIEREWWLEEGPHRDYYCVEDEAGRRYWIFRSGHYAADKPPSWFVHGFFA